MLKLDKVEIANDLTQLGDLLIKNQICLDPGPFYRAASLCRGTSYGPGKLGYQLESVVFILPKPKGAMPKSIKSFSVHLSVYAMANLDSCHQDPFLNLSVDIEKYGIKACGTELKAAWHLDRHIGNPSAVNNAIHPLYHLQYGGKKMDHLLDRLGDTLIIQEPRIIS